MYITGVRLDPHFLAVPCIRRLCDVYTTLYAIKSSEEIHPARKPSLHVSGMRKFRVEGAFNYSIYKYTLCLCSTLGNGRPDVHNVQHQPNASVTRSRAAFDAIVIEVLWDGGGILAYSTPHTHTQTNTHTFIYTIIPGSRPKVILQPTTTPTTSAT